VTTVYTEASLIRKKTIRSDVDLDALNAWAVANGAKRGDFLDEYCAVVLAGCIRMSIDPIIVYAQGHLETAGWTSPVFVAKGNPAGIGVTGYVGGPSDASNSQTFANGTEAAMGHLAHLVAYLWPEDWEDSGWPESWPQPWDADKRFDAPGKVGYMATDLASLGRQRYADGMWRGWSDNDYDYGKKIAERANLIAGVARKDVPVTDGKVVFGRVPMPVHERRIVENSRAWNDLGARTIRGVVWHRMYGTLWGTDGYFRGAAAGTALTDIGIGVEATDGRENDGRCFMWNDPRGRRAPWANGPATKSRDDGKKFIDRYGVNGVNRDLFSIEVSGLAGSTPLSEKARRKIVEWTAYWADQYKVSHETFPAIPAEGRSFVIWHGEINGDKWGVCPGAVIEGQTNAMIAEVKALLKQYQEGTAVEYADPQPVSAGTRVINDRLFVGVDKVYTIQRLTTPRLWADPSSPATGDDLAPGAKVTVSHMVEDIGESSGLTLVLQDGSRIPALALVAA